jgi:hypothetical protein
MFKTTSAYSQKGLFWRFFQMIDQKLFHYSIAPIAITMMGVASFRAIA